jgi:cell division protein FtsL
MAIIAFFLILFGVALLQTVLVQGQIHLDGLRADVADRQTEVQIARQQVNEAGSPGHLIDMAEGLGMVEQDPTFVSPPPEADTAAP